jgi:hypothetical protein
MKAILACLALAAAALPSFAQGEAATQAERARITAERDEANKRYTAEEVGCYRKFAVNDCLNAARSVRRERLSDLRRQEITLNDAERKRRASERIRSLEERSAEKKQEDSADKRAGSVQRFHEREADLARRAAGRAEPGASAAGAQPRSPKAPREAGAAAAKAPHAARVHDGAEALRRHALRQQEARERRERVAKRQAEAAKPNVHPLPVPP